MIQWRIICVSLKCRGMSKVFNLGVRARHVPPTTRMTERHSHCLKLVVLADSKYNHSGLRSLGDEAKNAEECEKCETRGWHCASREGAGGHLIQMNSVNQIERLEFRTRKDGFRPTDTNDK